MAFLFQGKSEKEISINCKLCLADVKFVVTLEEYQNVTQFPLVKESVHGTPPHKLIISLDKNLDLQEFNIEDIIDRDVSYSKELTYQVLSDIQLTEEEIELYFLTTGRDAVSLGEISILIKKDKGESKIIADKFVEKGLYKEIIGATPHYAPLPPYAALIKQLATFDDYIKNIKEQAPAQLNESFSQLEAQSKGINELNDYTNFIRNLKDRIESEMKIQKIEVDKAIKVIGEIRRINDVISNLENDTKIIVEEQIKDIEEQFEEMKKLIGNNLQELHLGVISKTVHQIIDNVLNTRMQTIVDGFNTKLLSKIKAIMSNIVENINEITASSLKTGETLEVTFSSVTALFNESVSYAEEKVKGISDQILSSFENLRNTFSTRVVNKLSEELLKILNRLEISQITTREFWDQAKKKSVMSMKDIWFIRSVEGARAHINEEISKSKMRILIVAPNLSEINTSILQSLPKHINIRIATNVNTDLPEHIEVLQKLEGMQNVSYRNRQEQDLWGINRDYEEVILCILSKREGEKEEGIEIGGIGSIVQQHIKIFVPVLEEAWIGAQKTVVPSMRPSYTQIPVQSSGSSLMDELKQDSIPSALNQHQSKPVTPLIQNYNSQNKVNLPSSTNVQAPTQSIPPDTGDLSIGEQLDLLVANLSKQSGQQLAVILENIKTRIQNEIGYVSMIGPITNTIADLNQISGSISLSDEKGFANRITFWKKKLNL
ncbi:MAG: methyl-accepting chemotaxis protein [Candidatus Lokiarchaeota archaeon]|nr:methyl-accepting chemotaxis protein [Candidatus Lokiarchaeota archaeon]